MTLWPGVIIKHVCAHSVIIFVWILDTLLLLLLLLCITLLLLLLPVSIVRLNVDIQK